jgi:hypothetical protein
LGYGKRPVKKKPLHLRGLFFGNFSLFQTYEEIILWIIKDLFTKLALAVMLMITQPG